MVKINTKMVIVYIGLAILMWYALAINLIARGIPNSKCEWYYSNDYVITSCGYKMVDGCPQCGKEIYIHMSEIEEENVQ